ncbi:MAG: diaminopimelate decarboxylase [Candidatus Thorarchaeota archaeon]
MEFGGIDLVGLADRYGTPLYVTHEDRIRENYRRIEGAFKKQYPKTNVNFACKANTNLAILRILEQEGSGIDAVSTGEIHLALNAGFSPERILYTANNFSNDELKYAVDKGVMINLDDVSQIEKLVRIGKPEVVSFRVNPEVGAGHHDHCITAGKNVKFGIIERDIAKAYELAREKGFEKFGIHMHIGSGILDPNPFELAVKKMMDVVGKLSEKGVSFGFIDIGGGFGVPYKGEKELDVEKTAQIITDVFKEGCSRYGLGEPYLYIEPGRYLVCDSTILLTRVNTVKKAYRNFVGVDAGFNVLIRPAFYGSYHEVIVANKSDEKPVEKYDIVGPICESGDVLAKDRLLPEVEENDILAVMNAGAYGFSMSSNYNSRPRPAEVLIHDGKSEIIREREGLEDLEAGQQIPERLRR